MEESEIIKMIKDKFGDITDEDIKDLCRLLNENNISKNKNDLLAFFEELKANIPVFDDRELDEFMDDKEDSTQK